MIQHLVWRNNINITTILKIKKLTSKKLIKISLLEVSTKKNTYIIEKMNEEMLDIFSDEELFLYIKSRVTLLFEMLIFLLLLLLNPFSLDPNNPVQAPKEEPERHLLSEAPH